MLRITPSCSELLRREAVQAYPCECCGFLLGREDGQVSYILRCKNEAADRHNTFLISAAEYRKAEKWADENELRLIGVYHSHPDSAATPSRSDRAAALPYFSYPIISVTKEGKTAVRSWKLNEQSHFEEEEIISQNITFLKKDTTHGHHYYSYTLA